MLFKEIPLKEEDVHEMISMKLKLSSKSNILKSSI